MKVKWDDDIPNIRKVIKFLFQTVVSTPLKNKKVKWEGLSHKLWKIKFMFQTSNQIRFPSFSIFVQTCSDVSIDWIHSCHFYDSN